MCHHFHRPFRWWLLMRRDEIRGVADYFVIIDEILLRCRRRCMPMITLMISPWWHDDVPRGRCMPAEMMMLMRPHEAITMPKIMRKITDYLLTMYADANISRLLMPIFLQRWHFRLRRCAAELSFSRRWWLFRLGPRFHFWWPWPTLYAGADDDYWYFAKLRRWCWCRAGKYADDWCDVLCWWGLRQRPTFQHWCNISRCDWLMSAEDISSSAASRMIDEMMIDAVQHCRMAASRPADDDTHDDADDDWLMHFSRFSMGPFCKWFTLDVADVMMWCRRRFSNKMFSDVADWWWCWCWWQLMSFSPAMMKTCRRELMTFSLIISSLSWSRRWCCRWLFLLFYRPADNIDYEADEFHWCIWHWLMLSRKHFLSITPTLMIDFHFFSLRCRDDEADWLRRYYAD